MTEEPLKSHLLEMFGSDAAHISLERALEGFPVESAGTVPEPVPHSMWMLVEHLRIVNRDFIDWVEAEEYAEKAFPSGYWPESPAPPDAEAWERSLEEVASDMNRMREWVAEEGYPFTTPLARRSSHTALREVLLALVHNGYHIGQMVDLRFLLGCPVRDW